MSDVNDFNATVINEFRSNNGHVDTAGFGKNLVLLHTLGAKSGEPRISPLFALPDADSWLVKLTTRRNKNIAAVAMALSSVSVIGNSLRLRTMKV